MPTVNVLYVANQGRCMTTMQRSGSGWANYCSGQVASNLIKPRAVLATVKPASRRLLRWPTASLDRRSARRTVVGQAGAEKQRSSRTEKHLRRHDHRQRSVMHEHS